MRDKVPSQRRLGFMATGFAILGLCAVAVASPAADVTSFTLIDADTDTPIAAFDPLVDGASFVLTDLPTTNLNVRANVDGMVGSVSFALTGADTEARTENAAPYALFGDSGGDYNAWTPPLGAYSLVARSHTGADGGGTAGVDHTIAFEVTGDDDTPPDGDGGVTVVGSLMRWHRVTVELSGPGATETSLPHPFLDHRYNVRFVGPSGQTRDVPGYFAGDGDDSGEGTVASGTVWRAHLAPDEVGTWTYAVSFRVGAEVAVDTTGTQGVPLEPFDGATGNFVVGPSNKLGDDFRAPGRGLIANRGGHYLSEADGDPWIKGGPNIPENFMGFVGFDNTPDAGHAFTVHESDWMSGDPDWNAGAGRAIIGALNYIAARGGNVIYFLPMNIGGDGQDTFPTIGPFEKTRYDLSKLAQWELVFTHAQSLGIFLHVVLAETEAGNENYHDGGNLGPERKLYYRMLLARFGHHPGLQLNLGEENDYGSAKHMQFAAYLKAVDPYDHPVTTHTKGNQYDAFYLPLLGNADFDLTSFQGNASRATMFDLIQSWREQSAAASVPWVISFDEPQKIENDVNDDANGYPHGRRDKMWPVYMAGGGGFEWYVQQDGGGHSFDQQIDDFGLMEEALLWTGHARAFFALLPLDRMAPDRGLASSAAGGESYVLAEAGNVYAVYNDRNGGPFTLDLSAGDPSATFDVRWFDPRTGVLDVGDVTTVTGGALADLGSSPNTPGDDWACLVVRQTATLFLDGFESGDTSAWTVSVP